MNQETKPNRMTLVSLYRTILSRKQNPPEGSYVASLFESGNLRVTQKVGEEAIEVVIAATSGEKQRLVSEIADLVFHLLVLLVAYDVTPTDVMTELAARNTNRNSTEKRK